MSTTRTRRPLVTDADLRAERSICRMLGDCAQEARHEQGPASPEAERLTDQLIAIDGWLDCQQRV
jgi:hypothetical protein